jgi:2-polyprenyl-3-methyl-5-hydroxy-6-metoxy-1,4-benzoquinol methylase
MSTAAQPAPDQIFDSLFAYQQTAALKAAIDLDLFTSIDEGASTSADLAARVGASPRGVRILCDYLTTLGFLTKSSDSYALAPHATMFLSRRSPAYLGTTAQFLTLPDLKQNFDDLTETVRRGGVRPAGNTVAHENPIWVEFARAMAPMAMPAAQAIAAIVDIAKAGSVRVLDIAAGHGMYGITLAQHNPAVRVTAVDWAPVLSVALENAQKAGVADRFEQRTGDAFSVDFGSGYDLALITNFLHHFDTAQNTEFLRKVAASLTPSGRVAIVEFVPNPDRVTPPMAARFSLTMLAGTPSGDAYTFDELRGMLDSAGFRDITAHKLPTPQTVLVAHR